MTSGLLPLIQSQASCWVAGARWPSGAHYLGERSQRRRRHRRRDFAPGVGPERDDEIHTARRHIGRPEPPERGQRLRRTHAGRQIELEEMVSVGSLREDPELRKREAHEDREGIASGDSVSTWNIERSAAPACRSARICLGTMMFGAWGNTDIDDCVATINAAIDGGINFVDTADVYSAANPRRSSAAR